MQDHPEPKPDVRERCSMLLGLRQLEAVPTALGTLFHAHCSLGSEPFPDIQPEPHFGQVGH